MFIASNDDMVVFDTMFDFNIGLGPICYERANFINRFGLIIPCGSAAFALSELLIDAKDVDQLNDPAFVKRYLDAHNTCSIFYMDWNGVTYICTYNKQMFRKVPLPIGKHWTVTASLENGVMAAFNNSIHGRVLSPAELRIEFDRTTPERLLRPEIILKSEFMTHKPDVTEKLPNFTVDLKAKKEKSK